MRIIHTADWHLGKSLKSQPLIDDQVYILNELLKILDDARPDAVVIAGDVYDRSIPPVDAVSLFDEIVVKIIGRKIPVLCISGNHDSAGRMNFGSRLFERAGFFVNTDNPVVLEDKFGEVYFTLMPYFAAAEIKSRFAQDAETFDNNAATEIYIANARRKIPAGKRSVAVAHLFATGGVSSESERKFVGGVGNVDAEIFNGYNYTALGHLHKPQKISGTVRYSGSILKYSFDESHHDKGVTIVDIGGGGEISVEHVALKPRRDVRIIEGALDNLRDAEVTDDYIHANLTDRNYILNAMDKLRGACPNILSLSFVNLEREVNSGAAKRGGDVSTLEYFADFFEHETGEALSGDYRSAIESLLAELEAETTA